MLSSSLIIWHLILVIIFFHDPTERQWLVTANSKLEISGTTNVNRFHCLSTDYPSTDTLTEYFDRKTRTSILEGGITLMASNFDCHNDMTTRDFKKTLRTENHPEVYIRFLQLKRQREQKPELTGTMEIVIAGVSKRYPVTCLIKSAGNNEKHLEGTRSFKFSDFGLQPPDKLFGAIKVEDNISVNFHLRLKAT